MSADRPIGYVISDLHVGGGGELEDFHQDNAFAGFVEGISRPGTTLVINGDFIDFPQIEPLEPDASLPARLLWDEDTSLEKLDRAIAAHPLVFGALRRFLTAGGQLHMAIGNHDLDLAWPRVHARMTAVLEAPPDRLDFPIGPVIYHGVYIRHGFHFCRENSPDDPESFIHLHSDGRQYLERVWGTDFVISLLNPLETRYPFAVKAKPTLRLLAHGVQHRWVGPRDIARFARYLVAHPNARALRDAVLGWGDQDALELIARSFADDYWRALVVGRWADPGDQEALNAAVQALPPADQHALALSEPVELGGDAELGLADGQDETLGLIREPRDRREARRVLNDRTNGCTAVVFGHTHQVVNGDLEGGYFNPGSWIPRLELRRPDAAAVLRSGSLTEMNDPSRYVTDRRAVEIRPDPPHRARLSLMGV